MTQNNNRAKLSEKGLLTPDNCVVAIIDLQPQMLFGVANFDRQTIINNNVALSKAAQSVRRARRAQHGGDQGLQRQYVAADPGRLPEPGADRALVDELVGRQELRRGGREDRRKKIVLAGLWTETCVALPTVQAIHDGYEVYVVEDCCGDVSQLAHDNAMKRVIQAGAKPVTALSVMLEWQRDWAQRDTYDAVMDIVKNHFGAYGVGVEYAYTMVHGAPATKYPRVRRPRLRARAEHASA